MTTRVQENRTATPNTPPANGALAAGVLYVEMADPMRLWAGVPTAVDATGRRLVIDVTAQTAANTAAVKKAGDTMTGPLVLSGNPTAPMQAATMAYADTKVASVAGRSGVVTLTHNDITDWVPTLAPYAPIANPVFTGNPQAPTPVLGDADTSIATTKFVADTIGAMPPPGATMAPGTPTVPTPLPGQLWFDTVGGQLYVRYDDGTSQQWVPATNIAGLANAATKTDVAAAMGNVGRNLIHNPLFNVAQRGPGPFTVAGNYLQDRWVLNLTTDTASVTTSIIGDGGRTAIGDEEAIQCLANSFTGNAAAGAFNFVSQPIESLRRLAGKTVTVSFWAVANVGTPKLGVSIDQYFGTGGSPSAQVNGNGIAVTTSTTWARFSATFAVPTIIGKTLGTNGDHCTLLRFWFSSGATNATRAGNVGVQSGIISIWGVQLEIGTVATPLEKPDPRYDLSNCQRFYQTGSFAMGGYTVTGYGWLMALPFPVPMRATPTLTPSGLIQTNCGSSQLTAVPTGFGYQPYTVATATGGYQYSGYFTASADL